MAVEIRKTNIPHIEWIDLNGDRTLIECAVMKVDNEGNIYHIPLNTLDDIDRNRMANIVTNRNANTFELWDLMTQTTLGNGINALKYFHQLVKVLTPSGQIIKPGAGRMGIAEGVVHLEAPVEAPVEAPTAAEKKAAKAAEKAAK